MNGDTIGICPQCGGLVRVNTPFTERGGYIYHFHCAHRENLRVPLSDAERLTIARRINTKGD